MTKPTLVLDFGVHPDELARMAAINPTNESEIAALIVDESDLARLGRWGGEPDPPRWTPPGRRS